MILTGEKKISLSKPRLGGPYSNTNVTWNSPRSNPCPCGILHNKYHEKHSEIEPMSSRYPPTQMSRETFRDRNCASEASSNTNIMRNSPRSNPCLRDILQHKCHEKQSEIEPVSSRYPPTQMSRETVRDRTRASAVRGRRMTARSTLLLHGKNETELNNTFKNCCRTSQKTPTVSLSKSAVNFVQGNSR